MLQLVVDNTNRLPNCKTSCALFDPLTEQCGIWSHAETENPNIYQSCKDRIPKQSWKTEQPEQINPLSMTETFEQLSFQGDEPLSSRFLYPLEPDVQTDHPDAFWYVSSDKTFGCWVINHYRKKVMNSEKIESPQETKRYRSLIPLHDHQSSIVLASNMCWFVDESGIGQYKMLVKDKLMDI